MLGGELEDNQYLISDSWDTERMIIRDANLHDLDRLQEIHMKSQNTEAWVWQDQLITDYILNAVNNGHLPPNGTKELFKIQSITRKDSSEIIGFIELYHGYPDKKALYIGTLLLSEDYRNGGYGQEVINKLFQQAQVIGFHQIRLGVTLKNWLGIYFWTKLGFDKITKFRGDKVLAKDSFALLELGKNLAVPPPRDL